MRVAFYQGTFQDEQDGTVRTMSRMVPAMRDAGIEHLVFTPLPPREGTPLSSVPVQCVRGYAFPAYPDYAVALPNRRGMWRALDTYAPDLVQVGTPDLGGRCLLKWALDRGVPAVGAYHTHFPTYLRYYRLPFLEGGLWRYFRWMYNNCAATLVPTKPIAAELREHGIKRLRFWPRGVDTVRFNPALRSGAFRARARVPAGGVLFAYAGRLVQEKNVHLVADAWRMVRRAVPSARLVWIGDGPERDHLRKKAPDALFPGYLLHEELSAAYASADVLVFCSVTETFGNVILEGMASGLPAIGIEAGGVGGVIQEGRTGLKISKEDPRQLAALMIRLAKDHGERARLAANALRHARSQSWDAVFARQFRVYEDVLRKRR